MTALCAARFAIAALPFRWWRVTLGGKAEWRGGEEPAARARQLAAHVEWGARRLPMSLKCLPKAMALSWMLQSQKIRHCVIFAVRPPELRSSDDQLHAWVEMDGEAMIGELPGPWVMTLRLGQ